ncbi:MAG: AAA family ATPase, partial [Armatimonadetes bacterium]|nr:AAA family ATPase [Armatimonadota bacterium]
MITSVKIERLRGIKEGELNNLTPLTVLVGGNGSGKSTVLEALYIGANGSPYDAICYVLKRRIGLPNGIPWIMWKRGFEGETKIRLFTNDVLDRPVTTLIPKNEMLLFAQSNRTNVITQMRTEISLRASSRNSDGDGRGDGTGYGGGSGDGSGYGDGTGYGGSNGIL